MTSLELHSMLSQELQLSIKPRTLDVWTCIYNYVDVNQYADAVDEGFIGALNQFELADSTIRNHLRRMERAGLLHGREMVRQRGQKRLEIFVSHDPSRIIRYTLPGVVPPKQLYRD